MKTRKEMSKPEKFIYIAGRPYQKKDQEHYFLPEALTEEKGDRIAEQLGKELKIKFSESPLPKFDIKARLEDYAKIPVKATDHPLYKDFDWFYRFRFSTDKSLEISEYKDEFIESEEAYKGCLAHCGTQRWGGLTIELFIDKDRLLCTDVDVFTPQDSSKEFVLGLYSHKK